MSITAVTAAPTRGLRDIRKNTLTVVVSPFPNVDIVVHDTSRGSAGIITAPLPILDLQARE